MIFLLLAVLPIFVLLVLSEFFWRAKLIRGEAARKVLHIIIGSYVAVWPFFLTVQQIELISLALFIGVSIAHKFKIFHAILDIKRHTVGDLLYAIGIAVTAFVAKSPWIFAIAILHMSVADGLAGLIGSKFGKKNRYFVFKQAKSIVGTSVFMVTSIALMSLIPIYQNINIGYLIILLPVTAAFVENLTVFGTDNVAVPLLIAVVLNATI